MKRIVLLLFVLCLFIPIQAQKVSFNYKKLMNVGYTEYKAIERKRKENKGYHNVYVRYYFTPYKIGHNRKPSYKLELDVVSAVGSWLRALSSGSYTVAITIWNNPDCKEPLVDSGSGEKNIEEYTILVKNVTNLLHNKIVVYIPAEVINASRVKYQRVNEGRKEAKFYLETRFFKENGGSQVLNEQNLIIWMKPKLRKNNVYGPGFLYPQKGDVLCKHFFKTRTKGKILKENTDEIDGGCHLLERHCYEVMEKCFNCGKVYGIDIEHNDFTVDNPDAFEDCNLMTYSIGNLGYVGNYEIYAENQKGEKKLLEKRARGSKDNRDEMCPLHNMVLKDENHYVCTKCNIERYGGEPLMSPEPNPHVVEISKCVEPQITIDVNGVNVTLRRAASEGCDEALYLAETETTEQMWMAVYPNHVWNFNRDSKAALDYVTYEDAMMFISMLNKMSEDKGWNLHFFLPTVDEWIMAFHLGNVEYDAWLVNNSGKFPHKVGEKPANLLKVFDMQGNVAEMCEESLSLDECDDTYDIYYNTTYEDGRRNHFNAYAGTGYLDDPYEIGSTDVRVVNLSTGKPQIGFRIFAVPK